MPEAGAVRVLHVITRMVKGGAQENTLATVAGIQGRGWDSALITGPAEGLEGSLEPAIRARGVRTIPVPDLVRELSPRQDLAATRALVRIFRAERPHLVHTHTSKAGILGRVAARMARIPAVIHTPHGHVFHSYESGLKTRIFVTAERFCAPLADRLVALTEQEKRETLEFGVGREANWRVIHSGVELAPFRAAASERTAARAELGLAPEAQVVGTVGRLVPIKGQIYLIEAFARLPDSGDRHLLVVGDGELQESLAARARELRLAVRL
ncbi:MAG: glycosyltransferase family 4 protein, partial [Armatimonadetes bacterium]|nr:glycosyltransferase family 4 protein [Armatimonadota bacterium]